MHACSFRSRCLKSVRILDARKLCPPDPDRCAAREANRRDHQRSWGTPRAARKPAVPARFHPSQEGKTRKRVRPLHPTPAWPLLPCVVPCGAQAPLAMRIPASTGLAQQGSGMASADFTALGPFCPRRPWLSSVQASLRAPPGRVFLRGPPGTPLAVACDNPKRA
jgi:hypothetical protein